MGCWQPEDEALGQPIGTGPSKKWVGEQEKLEQRIPHMKPQGAAGRVRPSDDGLTLHYDPPLRPPPSIFLFLLFLLTFTMWYREFRYGFLITL
jgi:hypothetical protein